MELKSKPDYKVLSQAKINELLQSSIHKSSDPNNKLVAIGKFRDPYLPSVEPYFKFARQNNFTYFLMTKKAWNENEKIYGPLELFKVNELFLQQQVNSNMIFICSHPPHNKRYKGSFFEMEIQYLEKRNYKFTYSDEYGAWLGQITSK